MPDGKDTQTDMTKEDAARIQAANQKDGKIETGTFPARAQAAADKHENEKKQ